MIQTREVNLKVLAALLMLPASIGASSGNWNSDSCGEALQRAYGFFSVRPQSTTLGDFNGDGELDFASLLDGKASNRRAIGICLSKEARPLLINSPYQSIRIFTKPKGTPYLDVATEKPGIYELDAIAVSDGGWLGASYILRAGVFVQVVDGD